MRSESPLARISTAADISGALDLWLLNQLPPGCVLNLGAGAGQDPGGHTRVINMDHVAPVSRVGLYVIGDATRLPFRDGAFDGALLKDILEHLDDPIGALTDTRRVVRHGGGLIAQVPRAIPRAVWDDPTHIRGFTARAVTTAVTLSGWRATRPQRIGGFPGARRLRLLPYLTLIMRVPGFGRWFGTNWLIRAVND